MYVPEGLECRERKRQVWEVVVRRRNSSCTAKEMHPAASGRSSTYSVLLDSLRPTTYSWSHKEVGQSHGSLPFPPPFDNTPPIKSLKEILSLVLWVNWNGISSHLSSPDIYIPVCCQLSRPSPSVFAFSLRSKTGGGNGLGTRLVQTPTYLSVECGQCSVVTCLLWKP